MKGISKWITFFATRSFIFLIIWLYLCLTLYLILPNSPEIKPQQLSTVELNATQNNENSQQLMDLQQFNYLIEQSPCGAHIQTIIMVHSAPLNIEKRSVIRETWGGKSVIYNDSPLRLLFLFGAVENDELQSKLLAEQTLHGDLLQGNFQDAYFNLTYKHVMALKWFHTHCKTAQFLFKVDDDIYVNTPQLLQLPHGIISELLHQTPPEELLLCARKDKDRVLRSYYSKWRVSFREYGERYYPPFCPGFAVLYLPDVVKRLYWTAQRSQFFRLDDVFITGLLASRSNITITDLSPLVLYPEKLLVLLDASTASLRLDYLVSWHKMSAQQIKRLWQLYGQSKPAK